MHFLSRIVDLSKTIKTLYHHHTLYYSIEYSEIRGNHMVPLSCQSKIIILRAHFFLGITLVFLIVSANVSNNIERKCHAEFLGKDFEQPQDDCDTWTSSIYFKLFWKDYLNVLLAEQTKLYSVQRTSTSINTNNNEISQLIWLQMYMSVIYLPCYRMYWARETRYSPIADVMPVNR